jgi:large subunit ribosomal protein L21
MYAVVDITGHQYKVEKGQTLLVNRVTGNEGDSVEFNEVLLTDKNGKVTIGVPVVKGAKVSAKIVEHLKGDKVIIFKKKRRKGYTLKRGTGNPCQKSSSQKLNSSLWLIKKVQEVQVTDANHIANDLALKYLVANLQKLAVSSSDKGVPYTIPD